MSNLPARFRHTELDSVPSTNKIALEAALSGDPGNLWITATEQTEGRGRRGRAWVSERGNLYASLLLINPAEMKELAHLPLVVATAVHRAVCDVMPPNERAGITIKWPNDVLWGNDKICGILLENSISAKGDRAVVIGIGINCGTHPDQTDGLGATHLSRGGFSIDPKALFERLANHMAERLDIWDQGRGLALIREDWMGRARGIGKPIVARLPGEELHGTFERLDEEGGLVLLMDNGQRRVIYAGDVFWPDAQ